MRMERDLKRYAGKQLTRAGFNCMPVRSDKRPALSKWKIRQDVPLTEFELDDYFRRHDAEIAIITGETQEHLVNVLVLDADRNGALERIMGWCRTEMISRTPDGHHCVFQLPLGLHLPNKVNIGNLGIDIRSQGGYAVSPPSFTDGFRREWLHGITPATQLPLFPVAAIQDLLGNKDQPQSIQAPMCSTMSSVGMGPVRGHIKSPEAWCMKRMSIQGQRGSAALVRVVCAMRDAGRTPQQTFEFIKCVWGPACCRPEWSDREILHAINRHYRLQPKTDTERR